MSKRMRDFSEPKRNWARVRAISVLPTPVGPRKRKLPMGRAGFLRPARERRMARARAEMAFSCEMTRLCSSSSTRSSLAVSSSLMDVMGTPVQRLTTSSMSSRVTMPAEESSRWYLSRRAAQVLALLALLVGVEAGLLELVVRDGVLHAMHDEFDALLDFGEFFGEGGLAQLDARACLVDEVDRLVRQEAVRDVAAGVGDGERDRVVGV